MSTFFLYQQSLAAQWHSCHSSLKSREAASDPWGLPFYNWASSQARR